MAPPPDGIAQLRAVARRLLWSGLACLALPAVTWLGAALYDSLAAPADGGLASLAGILAVVARVGLVLVALGLLASGWAWRLRR